MKLEQQVCSLELAKRLKELGVPQESLFWWMGVRIYPESEMEDFEPPPYWGEDDYCSAFTVAELGEMLPEFIHSFKYPDGFVCESNDMEHFPPGKNHLETIADTEANARATMLIYLLEKKLITL